LLGLIATLCFIKDLQINRYMIEKKYKDRENERLKKVKERETGRQRG
jgi:hypothetical protein